MNEYIRGFNKSSMNRNSNYVAFYVAEPFSPANLGAKATQDFCYYQMLKAWKGRDTSFPFNDAHAKTYDVRDDSDWMSTLRPRLRCRLRASKNIILFLSLYTKESRALKEEIEYGACELGLPIIVVYPGLSNRDIVWDERFTPRVRVLWDKLPVLKKAMGEVPTIHIPMEREYIEKTLLMRKFTVQNKEQGVCHQYFYRK